MNAGERVLLILLDALGSVFLERHRDHPLMQRLAITPLRSQFPSTTTAHVSTIHFGLPVEVHGLYEWRVLEPSLDEVIIPLRWALASPENPRDLSGLLDPDVLAPGPTFYETLEGGALVAQPADIADSVFTRLATAGARVLGFRDLGSGTRAVVRALREPDAPRHALLYWDGIDRAGHESGPGARAFDAAARKALDAVWREVRDVRDITVLITADHGQIDVRPDRVDYLDELWPELPDFLTHLQPAGSSRDVFLHVREGEVETVVDELSERLGARAHVHRAAELFTGIGPRLDARLGDVVVLPGPGRQAWLRRAAAQERWFRGQHGGLLEAETATYLGELTR